jgi:predicted nucleic acid-binding protein
VIVVDTSVVMTFVMQDDETVNEVLRQDRDWIAPPLWRSEFRNALAGHIRVMGLSVLHAVDAFDKASQRVTELAVNAESVPTSPCSAYDLEFVALAQSLDVPFVTFDRQVLAAFPAVALHPQDFVAS